VSTTIDQPWFLPIVSWALPAIFLGVIGFTLWSGKLYGRGTVYLRNAQPNTYWCGIAFLALCAVATLWMAVSW
jgi:hypothetical protein